MLLKRTPFRCSLNFGNRKKSDGARSGLKGGCGSNSHQSSLEFPLSSLQNALEHCHDGEGVRFNSTDEAKHAAKTWLRNQSAEFFKNGINEWKHRSEKCIDRDGGYVEK